MSKVVSSICLDDQFAPLPLPPSEQRLAEEPADDGELLLDPSVSPPSSSDTSASTDGGSHSLLSPPAASLLITAECVGTGILALPYFCYILPRYLGVFYLLCNYFVNIYCAFLLCSAADAAEAHHGCGPIRDLVNLASSVASMPHLSSRRSSWLSLCTRFFFTTNLFLLLGTYLLAMSKGFAAAAGRPPSVLYVLVCLSVLMVLTASFSKMSQLGRAPTYVSIATVAIILAVCLSLSPLPSSSAPPSLSSPLPALVVVPSSFAGITFAVGSQKLLLNVRSEMEDKASAPKSLVWAITGFCSLYVAVVMLAPPSPPPLLLDAVTNSAGKVLAGVALCVHIAVSFTINSQCLVSMIRDKQPGWKWGVVSVGVCGAVFCVVMIIPFFEDLTSLIGSLTLVPMSMILPVFFHLAATGWQDWTSFQKNVAWGVVAGSCLAMTTGVVSTFGKIILDWENE